MLLALAIMTACRQPAELPTLAPTLAAVDTPGERRATPIPATNTPAIPTATLTPSATPVVLTPQPTPLAGPGVNITSPAEGSEVLLGSEVVASGLVQTGPGQTISVTLTSATGHLLAEAQPEASQFNSWQVTLTIPQTVSGRAIVTAKLVNADGTVSAVDETAIALRVDPDGTDRYLILYRPLQDEQAVAGYNIFFDGEAELPADNIVTISLWTEACQNRVALQSYRLRGSGYWQGFVVVPSDAGGDLCAVASFGEPGEDSWREAQVEIEVLDPTDDRAMNVVIGNPPPDEMLTPGQSLLLYGTAYNAPEREVLVSILLENGRLLTEGVAAADIFGYWELELFIPANASGPAQIEASLGEPGSEEFVQSAIPIAIGGES